MGFYDVCERPAPRCKSPPVMKCFARLVAARCRIDGDSVGCWNALVVGMWFWLLVQHHVRAQEMTEQQKWDKSVGRRLWI